MKKLLIWLFVLAVVAVAGWLYFSSGDEPSASSFDLTRYGVAKRGDLTVSISAVGAVEPIHAIEIKSKASGEIIELAFEEGDFVSEGELLVRLDPTTVRNEYDQAKADFEVAQVTLEQRGKDLKRQKDLYDRGLISETDYDAARLSYEEANSQHVRARAALSTNTERLEDTEIRSPISGLVLSRQVEEGQIISSGTSSVTGGTLLYIIADMAQVNVITDVDETDIGRVQTGLGARVVADAYPDRTFDGEVKRIAPLAKVEQNVTMFEVTVLVDNSESLLKAGMNADVEMVIDEVSDVVLVPVRAVQTRMARRDRPNGSGGHPPGRIADSTGGPARGHPPVMVADSSGGPDERHPRMGGQRPPTRQFVQVVEGDEIIERPVRMGLANLDYVEIIEGVQPGDSLVWTLTSGAMAGREQFMERMRNRSAVPGMRSR